GPPRRAGAVGRRPAPPLPGLLSRRKSLDNGVVRFYRKKVAIGRRPVYVISIAAGLAGCHPRTLRIYEEEGLLEPVRTQTNIRLYSDDDLERIRAIRYLTQIRGVNLAGVKLLLQLRDATELLREIAEELETKDAYRLRADLPGLTAEDIEINATSETITLGGETKAQADVTDDGWLRQERRTGKFQRAFTLPVEIDPNKIEAKLTNGVLELVVPKAESTKPRTIKISANNK